MENAWRGFIEGNWNKSIDVRDFIQKNYTPYEGNESFLAAPTERTKKLNDKYEKLHRLEQEWGGVLDIDTNTVSSLLTHKPGYLDKENEIILP